jgi:hypothetical protein
LIFSLPPEQGRQKAASKSAATDKNEGQPLFNESPLPLAPACALALKA